MELVRNSIWSMSKGNVLSDGRYRILAVASEKQCVVLYALDSSKKTNKPLLLSIARMKKLIDLNELKKSEFKLPIYYSYSESELSKKSLSRRNDNYKLIEPLISDLNFLFNYSADANCKIVTNYSKSVNKNISTIYRILNLYWRYGQTPNAVMPAYANSGALGTQRKDTLVKRGCPIKKSKFGFSFKKGVNVSEKDKINILKGFKKYFKSDRNDRWEYACKLTHENFYFDELEDAHNNNRSANVFNTKQFKYWAKKLGNEIDIHKKLIGEVAWKRDYRGFVSTVSEHVFGPGDRFEIDATIADVHLVSTVNRHALIGRPVVYSVVDQASRMIVGLGIGVQSPSWASASEALYNAFTSKIRFCDNYGIEVLEKNWPCRHSPRALLCDNGEMLHNKPEECIPSLGIPLEFAPVYRGDAKSIVERRFGIANEVKIHDLPGTTKGRIRKRGEKDPRFDAVLNLDEFAKILINLFIKHNCSQQFDELATKEMLIANVEPTPINFWNLHIKNHQHSLISLDEDLYISELLPNENAYITRNGIKCRGMLYTCNEAEEGDWYSKARNYGNRSCEARYFESTGNEIFIRLNSNSKFIRCTLRTSEKLYHDHHSADILYMQEWRKDKANSVNDLYADAIFNRNTEKIVKNAQKEKDAIPFPTSKKAKLENIKSNRKKEIDGRKNPSGIERISNNSEIALLEQKKEASPKLMQLLSIGMDDEPF